MRIEKINKLTIIIPLHKYKINFYLVFLLNNKTKKRNNIYSLKK